MKNFQITCNNNLNTKGKIYNGGTIKTELIRKIKILNNGDFYNGFTLNDEDYNGLINIFNSGGIENNSETSKIYNNKNSIIDLESGSYLNNTNRGYLNNLGTIKVDKSAGWSNGRVTKKAKKTYSNTGIHKYDLNTKKYITVTPSS